MDSFPSQTPPGSRLGFASEEVTARYQGQPAPPPQSLGTGWDLTLPHPECWQLRQPIYQLSGLEQGNSQGPELPGRPRFLCLGLVPNGSELWGLRVHWDGLALAAPLPAP